MKTNKNQNYGDKFTPPAVLNRDALANASDDDLEKHIVSLNFERDRAVRENFDPRPWEVELCYAQNEVSVRHSRKAAHERYLRSNPEAYTYNQN